jgi:hypothetical protein
MSYEVKDLITKAAKASMSDDALRFSQAACNAANALCALENARKMKSESKSESETK